MPTQVCLIAGLIIAAVVQTAIIAIPAIPLGVPGEWEWRRHVLPASFMAAVAQFIPAIVGATVLLCVARFGNNRLLRQHRRIAENEAARASGCCLRHRITVFGLWNVGLGENGGALHTCSSPQSKIDVGPV